MKYVIGSTIVMDEIHFPKKTGSVTVPGGAGIYALAGARLFDDDVLPVPGGGKDFQELFGKWFEENHISMEGIRITSGKTPRNLIQYYEDGERSEIPLYGEAHYHLAEVKPEYLEEAFRKARGIYLFRNSDSEFWEPVCAMKDHSCAKVLWEIAADCAYAENIETVQRIAQKMDILSLNITEAKRLTGVGEEETIRELSSWDVPLIFLRMGDRGCAMIRGTDVIRVPAGEGVQVIDPTGGGNSSSGAVLVGYCEGKSPLVCARMGNQAAAMCISVYGVPEQITERMRSEARTYAESQMTEREGSDAE